MAAVIPGSWVGALDRPYSSTEPTLPLHLLYQGQRVAYGLAEQVDRTHWSAVFVPGTFEGVVDSVEYQLLGQTRIKPLGDTVHVTSGDSLEIIVKIELSYS